MLAALARLVTAHPRRVLAATVALLAVAIGFGAPVTGKLTVDPDLDFVDPAAQSNVTGNEAAQRDRPRPRPGHRRARAFPRTGAQPVRPGEAAPGGRADRGRSGHRADALRAGRIAAREPVRLARRPLELRRGLPALGRRRRGDRRADRAGARRHPRRARRRRRDRRPGRRRPGLRGSRQGRAARLPPALPAHARRLPRRDRGAAAPVRRPDDDHDDVPRAAAVQRGDVAVDLRAEPRDRPRARPGDRLLAVRPLALPRGDGARRTRPRGADAHAAHRRHGPSSSAR